MEIREEDAVFFWQKLKVNREPTKQIYKYTNDFYVFSFLFDVINTTNKTFNLQI